MNQVIVLLLLSVTPADDSAAWKDKENFPQEIREYITYLSLSDVPSSMTQELEDVTKVVVCSLSSATHLPSHIPVRVAGTNLLRINTQFLKWEKTYPKVIVAYYPYRPDLTANKPYPVYPTVVSALWFVASVTDAVRTKDAQDKLLYGEKPPVNLKELQEFWKVNAIPQNSYGFIEEDSGVSEAKVRFVEELPVSIRTYAFQTKDADPELYNQDRDPKSNLQPGKVKFDASEIIIGIPKSSSRKFGSLQAYWLTDGNGKRQEKAPAQIVADKFATRTHEIRNWISCISCHSAGIIPTTRDGYEQFFKAGAGAETYDYLTQQEIQEYLEVDMGGRIKFAQELYTSGIEMVCGLSPERFSASYVNLIKYYDANLSLKDAANELGCTEIHLKLALAYQSAKKVNLDPRLVELGHGVPILRSRWEDLAPLASYYVSEYTKPDWYTDWYTEAKNSLKPITKPIIKQGANK